jgi:ectoine hydroxylase-related dioxygenase (phytanoyl-CoA dioxygenase family)
LPRIAGAGAVVARPGAAAQHLHADGPHPDAAGMYHFFVPLVDVEADGDGTALWPGSHLTYEAAASAAAYNAGRPFDGDAPDLVSPPMRRGSMLAFDYRVVHRGNPAGDRVRPVAYFVVNTRDDDAEDTWNWSADSLLT